MRTATHHLRTRNAAHAGALLLGVAIACPAYAARANTSFVEVATRAGLFKTFLSLVDKARAADSLDAGPITVFMPTDRAFALLTAPQRDAISALSPEDARSFVNHFVIPGVALATNDIDPNITAEDGTSYNVTWYQGRLSLRDHQGPATGGLAFVVNGDNPAGLGFINAVDAVLLPASFGKPGRTQAADVQAAPIEGAPTRNAAPPETSRPSIATAVPPAPISAVEPAPSAPQLPAPSGSGNSPSLELQPLSRALDSSVLAATPTPATPQPDQGATPVSPSASAAPDQVTMLAPSPLPPPLPAASAKPQISVAAADVRSWQVKVSGSSTAGKVDRIIIGVPDGHITGIMAHFGGYFGFGGRQAYIPWRLVTADPQQKVLGARMTADDLKAAPSIPPTP
jgi:uncharacterized surface protein with fasciclin (FAS1) repeats